MVTRRYGPRSLGQRNESFCGSELLPAVLSAVIEHFDHVGQEDSAHLHALGGWGGVF